MSNHITHHSLKSRFTKLILSTSIALVLATSANAKATAADEVLVSIEDLTVTGKDLEEAPKKYTVLHTVQRNGSRSAGRFTR